MGRDPKWENFAQFTARCYKAEENGNTLNGCWNEAFNALMDVVTQERGRDSGFARELGDLEKLTDFKFNIVGLVLDYFDWLWQEGDYQTICTNADRMIGAFDWHVESSSAIRIKVVNALIKMGKRDEAMQYCMEWIKAEPEDVNAAMTKTALLKDTKRLETAMLADTKGEEKC